MVIRKLTQGVKDQRLLGERKGSDNAAVEGIEYSQRPHRSHAGASVAFVFLLRRLSHDAARI